MQEKRARVQGARRWERQREEGRDIARYSRSRVMVTFFKKLYMFHWFWVMTGSRPATAMADDWSRILRPLPSTVHHLLPSHSWYPTGHDKHIVKLRADRQSSQDQNATRQASSGSGANSEALAEVARNWLSEYLMLRKPGWCPPGGDRCVWSRALPLAGPTPHMRAFPEQRVGRFFWAASAGGSGASVTKYADDRSMASRCKMS